MTKGIVQDFLTEIIVDTEQTEDLDPEIEGNDIDFTTKYLLTRNASVYSRVNTIRKQSQAQAQEEEIKGDPALQQGLTRLLESEAMT